MGGNGAKIPAEQEAKDAIICGDCLEVMASMEPNSIDSIVTYPPYGLSFMGDVEEWLK